MIAIAERFVRGKTAAAQADGGAATQPVGVAIGIDKSEITLDAEWSIIEYSCIRRHWPHGNTAMPAQ